MVVLTAAVCSVCVSLIALLRGRVASPEELIGHLPSADSLVLFIDVDALRQCGILEAIGSLDVEEEPEYKAFVVETGFDYTRDLDQVLAAFRGDTTYFLVRGRFNWGRLKSYAASLRGLCHNSFCRVNGSTPKRNISFFPLARDVMALAVSPDGWAASGLAAKNPGATAQTYPQQPVWMLISPSFLKSCNNFPSGTRLFAKAMEDASRMVLTFGPRQGRLEIGLEVTCHSPEEASVLLVQLEGITRLLRELLAKEHKAPNPRDLSGVLAAGSFEHSGNRVLGRWPVDRAFIQNIVGGSH